MNKGLTYIGIGVAVIIGVTLLLAHVDRRFIALAPTPGADFTVRTNSDTIYSQTFIPHESNISRLGVYARPLTQQATQGTITVTIYRDSTVLGSASIPAITAMEDVVSTIRFTPPIPVTPRERLHFKVAVSPELNSKIGIQTRLQDETFNRDAELSINGEVQPNPLAYEVHHSVQLPILMHLGGLFLLLAPFWLCGVLKLRFTSTVIAFYAIGITLVANAPLIIGGATPYLVLGIQAILIWSALRFLPKALPQPSRLLFAHTLMFSAWWLIADRTDKALVDFLYLRGLNHFKDIFFDPNQLPLLPAAAYIGIPVGIFAVLGYGIWKREQGTRLIRSTAILLTILGLLVAPIIAAVGMALAGALGLRHMYRFLGTSDTIATGILYALTYIILLDTLTVYSRIIELYL